ncbi:MAG: asparagine synthase (glutamine-hydrolyzing) [Candidatus Eisenbacteria bacterium]|nr:asparagine synthase (glutamine-hydrolyzing) [Candidatus Eisenbacteria bacterium]
MCGIAGIAVAPGSPPPEEERIRAMCAALVHRGPDGEGIETRGNVGLGMRRLAVIDVEGGGQPIANEVGSIRVVFNGEIYNYRELRRDLEGRGHRFRTAADTEVLVHLYEERGEGMLPLLNGMFAFALHDERRARLLLARDHMGIKPLYWSAAPGLFLFGSEVKALLASGLIRPSLDLEGLAELLAWEYVPGAGTLMREVHKLEPATFLDLDLRSLEARRERYWRIPPPGEAYGGAEPRTDAEWEDAVDGKIGECVRRQMVSDVPLGALLSGGVDSSLVVAAMGEARTFSIGFDDPTYNELPHARAVAEHLGVSNRSETIRPDIGDLFEKLMPHLDDPIGDFSVFPTYLVSRLARDEVTVALTGDGGDELFGGYETYLAREKAVLWERIPRWIRRGVLEPAVLALPPSPKKKGFVNKARRFAQGMAEDRALGHARWRIFAGDALRRALFTDEALAALARPAETHVLDLRREAEGRDETDRALFVDARSYLVDNCLVKVDRMSMACSLEARVPLLDRELVELAFRMPSRLKVSGGKTKRLLKSVARRHVPPRCVDRPKEGFSIPIKHWLRRELKPLLLDRLAPERIRREGVFRGETVERLVREHLEGRENHSHVLWTMLVFEDWRERWSV